MSNFYDQFISDEFLTKKASDANIVDELSDIPASVLHKLASEIGAIIDEDDVMSLEEKIASDCESKKEDSEEKKEAECSEKEDSEEKKEAEDSEKEDSEEKKEAEDSEKEDSEEKKEAEDSEKEDSEEKKEAEDSEKEDSEEKKEAEDSEKEDSEEKKEAEEELTEEEREELLKKAYEIAEEKLAGVGCTLDDYVLNKVANEEIADFVISNSEKLAYVSNKPVLQVADDLINSIGDRFQ